MSPGLEHCQRSWYQNALWSHNLQALSAVFFTQLGYETMPRAPAIAVCIPGRGKWPNQHNFSLSHDLGTASAFQAPAPKNGWGQICIYFLHLCCATFQSTKQRASYLPRLQGLCDQLQRRRSGLPAMDGRECISSCTQTSFLNTLIGRSWKIQVSKIVRRNTEQHSNRIMAKTSASAALGSCTSSQKRVRAKSSAKHATHLSCGTNIWWIMPWQRHWSSN